MQTNIFGEVELSGITIDQAAKVANVSTATIRNWIKTGYLTLCRQGLISHESLVDFMANVAGKEKLNARANKLQKDEHDHEAVTNRLDLLMEKFSGESIGEEYEKLLSNSYRNKEGIYYTPSWIIEDMFRNLQIDEGFIFLDPCCGSGNFVVEAIKRGVAPENVYGFDVDENAVSITKQRIMKEFGVDAVNVKVGDFLNEAYLLKSKKVSFDMIFTNPPWGKKIDKADKEKFAALYACGSSLDTTSLFFGASLSLLSKDGYLGFLIQEAFFNITTFEDIRRKVTAKKILRLVDYGKAFKGLITKAQAVIIKNTNVTADDSIECSVNGVAYSRSLESFIKNPKRIFNFWSNENDAHVINKLYSVAHTTLSSNANWALGVVTGNNEKYCSDVCKEGYVPIYKGADITKGGLKEAGTFILNDFSNFQQVAPIEMYKAKEKIIYRFITSDLCFYYDTEQRWILNSANLFIPFGLNVSGKQLTDLLNSEVMNWLFKKLFATHKVLRSDLELLPLHLDYFLEYHDFLESDFLNFLGIRKTEDGSFSYN
jgi:site-specific DNA-methyltransferase (adenine-specific)